MSAYRVLRHFGCTKSIIYAAFLGLGLLPLSAFAVTAPVGVTPGTFAVNQNGGATYTIPLTVPPGTAGMVPRLALSYDKQVQNDLLGIGWSVSGLSLIRRCGRTIALDGMKGGVNYNADDRFCLDGQRLVAIKTGVNDPVYGTDGTEYHTEKESFSKIISYGAIPYPNNTTGPSYFKVLMKNGTVVEYGNTPDSKIEAAGKSIVRLWALNKIQDTKGNYLAISYFKDTGTTGTGEYRPTRIDYTGNVNASPTLSPYNSVRFVYATRPDIVPRYEGGSIIKTTQRLTNVQTCTTTATDTTNVQTCPSTALVRDYRLAYDNNGAVGSSRLISVTECGSDGVCLNPTVFNWGGNGNNAFTPAPMDVDLNALGLSANADPGNYAGRIFNNDMGFVQLGDFNGDGKMDILRQEHGSYATDIFGTIQVYLGNGDGTFTPGPMDANLNAPGLSLNADPGNYAGRIFNGDFTKVYLADFNGDGKTDILRQEFGSWASDTTGTIQVFLSNGDGTFTPAPMDGSLNVLGLSANADPGNYAGRIFNNDMGFVQLGDFNGDGKMDILRQEHGSYATDIFGTIQVYLGNGDGTFTPGPMDANLNAPGLSLNADPGNYAGRIFNGDFTKVYLADFNGDGKTDILRQEFG